MTKQIKVSKGRCSPLSWSWIWNKRTHFWKNFMSRIKFLVLSVWLTMMGKDCIVISSRAGFQSSWKLLDLTFAIKGSKGSSGIDVFCALSLWCFALVVPYLEVDFETKRNSFLKEFHVKHCVPSPFCLSDNDGQRLYCHFI